jgi:hypothetical protein
VWNRLPHRAECLAEACLALDPVDPIAAIAGEWRPVSAWPSAIALPGNIAFAVWLGAASVALWRLESLRSASVVPSPA